VEEFTFLIFYLFFLLFLFVLFVVFLSWPYLTYKFEGSKSVDQRCVEPENKNFYDVVPMNVLLYILAPLIAVVLFSVVLSGDFSNYFWGGGMVIFLGALMAMFYRLKITADLQQVTFGWGPIKKTLKMQDIVQVKTVNIHPIKDYMGYGMRSGSDGAMGYISSSKKGVRFETTKGKAYVTSTNRPDELVNLVKWAMGLNK